MGDVLGCMIEPLKRVYPMPKTAEGHEAAFLETYLDLLETFGDGTLAAATKQIIATRTQRSFPLPAECNLACAEAVNAEMIRARAEPKDGRNDRRDLRESRSDWEGVRTRRADDLFAASPFAEEALKNEWWWRLWSWILEHQRSPDVHEAKIIRSKGIADYRKYREDIQDNPFAKALNNWRNGAYNRISKLITEKVA